MNEEKQALLVYLADMEEAWREANRIFMGWQTCQGEYAFDLNLIKQEDLMNLHIQLWLMRNGIMRSKFLLDKGDLEVKQ